MTVYLKVKIKALAEEARIIRAEETKRIKYVPRVDNRTGKTGPRVRAIKNDPMRLSLRFHRITVVRSEARHSLLAYGYLRGRSYKAMEAKCFEKPAWDQVWKMIQRFGGTSTKADFEAWVKGVLPVAQAA
jgi:hypothetical protein